MNKYDGDENNDLMDLIKFLTCVSKPLSHELLLTLKHQLRGRWR